MLSLASFLDVKSILTESTYSMPRSTMAVDGKVLNPLGSGFSLLCRIFRSVVSSKLNSRTMFITSLEVDG